LKNKSEDTRFQREEHTREFVSIEGICKLISRFGAQGIVAG
jgi:hypothetical protein